MNSKVFYTHKAIFFHIFGSTGHKSTKNTETETWNTTPCLVTNS
jgi:hypothetical protein